MWNVFTSEGRKQFAKIVLTRMGARCSARTIYTLNGIFNYLHIGWWLRAHGFDIGARAASRLQIFDRIAADIAERRVLYLEFGVHQGDSIRYWSKLLRNPCSHLHGFDSFLGLPHDWSLEGHPRAYFSTGGQVPEVDDPRIEFFPGWFEETLPKYSWPDHEVLVVMFDADLYSSAATVLRYVKEKLVPGSYLYFDQLHHHSDELRAFAEFLDENDMRFRVVAATEELKCVAFQRLA